MSTVLDKAERGYAEARTHYALMYNNPLLRGWCLFEFIVRILAAMRAKGLASPEEFMPFIVDRDPLFTRLVLVDGLSKDLDLHAGCFDKFNEMSTFDPADKSIIQSRIIEVCGSATVFNRILNYYRTAAIRYTRKVSPTQGESPKRSPLLGFEGWGMGSMGMGIGRVYSTYRRAASAWTMWQGRGGVHTLIAVFVYHGTGGDQVGMIIMIAGGGVQCCSVWCLSHDSRAV